MLWRRKAIDGCSSTSDSLMAILARKVRATVIAPNWIRKRLVGKEGF